MADKKDDETGKAEVDPKVSEEGLPEEETPETGAEDPQGSGADTGAEETGAAGADDFPITSTWEAGEEADADPAPETPDDTADFVAPEGTDAASGLSAPVHDPREEAMDDSAAAGTVGVEEAVLMGAVAGTAAGAEGATGPAAQDTPPETRAPETKTPETTKAETAARPAERQAVVEKRGGFGAALLGGVAAAAIGFGLAIWLYPDGTPFSDRPDMTAELQQQIDAQKSELESLRAQLEEATATPALDALRTQVSEVTDSLRNAMASLDQNTADLSNLRSRLEEVSASDIAENVSEQAQQAYETALSRLQETMAQQRSEIESMISESQQMKADAAATARATQIRANLTQIATALDSGDPFSTQLQELSNMGLEVPQALQEAAAAGVATMAQLRADFPDYARDALNATRDNGDTSSVMTFLKNQLGARSLTPREGDDPDAVLSRAEDALRQGQLQAALDELQALPETAQAEIEPWLTQAVARARAVAGLQTMQSANQSN